MKFAKKCLQFILKLQERLILFSATANTKFSYQTKFAPKYQKSLRILHFPFQDGQNRSHAMKETVNGKQSKNADPTYPLLLPLYPNCLGDRHGIDNQAKR